MMMMPPIVGRMVSALGWVVFNFVVVALPPLMFAHFANNVLNTHGNCKPPRLPSLQPGIMVHCVWDANHQPPHHCQLGIRYTPLGATLHSRGEEL
uniref:Putative secreted protein n=1 Tax=Anopheles darlingi TaxID=43151 RepID=A0A2M4DBU6_ANODA